MLQLRSGGLEARLLGAGFRNHLAEKLTAPHLTPFIGYRDHEPKSYWGFYSPTEYELDGDCDPQPGDRAGYLRVGSPGYVGNGDAKAMFCAMCRMVFSKPKTNRDVGEPAANSDAIISLMEQFGFGPQHELYFEKVDTGVLLMNCEWEEFNGSVPTDGETSHGHDPSEG